MTSPAGPVPSRLVARLDAAIAAATDPIQRDCLRAERACCLARQGSLDDARAVVADVQQIYDRHRHPEISAWLSLTEGLISHFSDMGPLAHDKLKRSHAMSVAANLGRIQALSAAWLAHLSYLRYDFTSMASHVSKSLKLATENDHASLSRSALVVAQGLHFAGRLDLAKPWYSAAQKHATLEGDISSISALLHNRAWLEAANLRQLILSGGELHSTQQVLLGAESSSNFDKLIGAVSLSALLRMLRAQILTLQGDAAAALALYERYADAARSQGMARHASWLFADQAWCYAQLGQLDAARSTVIASLSALDGAVQDDDRAATHGRLSLVYSLLDEESAAEKHRDLARPLWRSLQEAQANILELLIVLQLPVFSRPAGDDIEKVENPA